MEKCLARCWLLHLISSWWFPYCSGYHVRLTRGRSPVRAWPETLSFFVLLLLLLLFFGLKSVNTIWFVGPTFRPDSIGEQIVRVVCHQIHSLFLKMKPEAITQCRFFYLEVPSATNTKEKCDKISFKPARTSRGTLSSRKAGFILKYFDSFISG